MIDRTIPMCANYLTACLRSMRQVGAFVILLAAVPLVNAEEAKDRERNQRIAYLIELLASKNQAPKVEGDSTRGDDQTITFPREYDESLQVPVYLAANALLAEDEYAIDLLLAHKNDDRYSHSVNSWKDYNVSVSTACRRIAMRKLLFYEPELHVITRSQYSLFPPRSPDSFEEWWSKNKQRGLPTLQVEALDAAIRFMTEVDAETALPWHAAAARLPTNEFNRLRNANLEILKASRQLIVATGKPCAPKTLYSSGACFYGLPWGRRRHNL